MRSKLPVIVLLAATLGACTSPGEENPAPAGRNVVAFTIGPFSRSGVTGSADDVLSFGVFACNTGTTDYDDLAARTPGFMYNQAVTRTGRTAPWVYSPVKQWPGEGAKLSFLAYSPHADYITFPEDGSGLAFNAASVEGDPVVRYTMPLDTEYMVDLLYADPVKNQTSGTLALDFHHAMSLAEFYIKGNVTAGGEETYTILAMSVQGKMVRQGRFNLNTRKWTLNAIEPVIFTLTPDPAPIAAGQMRPYSSTASLLPIPQALDVVEGQLMLIVTYEHTVGGVTKQHTYSAPFPSTELTMGKVHYYVVDLGANLTGQEVEVKLVNYSNSIDDWEKGENFTTVPDLEIY